MRLSEHALWLFFSYIPRHRFESFRSSQINIPLSAFGDTHANSRPGLRDYGGLPLKKIQTATFKHTRDLEIIAGIRR